MARKNRKTESGGRKKGKLGYQVMLVVGMLTAIVFLPTTMILLIGMLPTPAAFLVDKTKRKVRVITVGAMNLAACFPFIFELWRVEHSFDQSFSIITDPMAIVVMYSGAAMGYMIDWAMTGIVSVFLLERGKARVQSIKQMQEDLVNRWGKEVRGDMPLDERGFAIESAQEEGPPPTEE